MNDVEIIDQIILSFRYYCLGDISKCRENGMPIASFILCTCFIDQLSEHRYYKQKLKEDKFITFIKEYFDSCYDPDSIYKDLRSKLVHNYSTNGKYRLTDGHPAKHLKREDNKTWINIDEFIKDTTVAFNKYCHQLLVDRNIQLIAINHYKKFNILKHETTL